MSKSSSRKGGNASSQRDPLAGIPRMARHSATYAVNWEVFLPAAHKAALELSAPLPGKWRIDGWKSDKLFLRLTAEPTALFPGTLDSEFDLETTEDQVTISVFTRLESQAAFFERFTQQLDLILPRSTP